MGVFSGLFGAPGAPVSAPEGRYARDVPGFDQTEPGRHGLWMDEDGNVYDLLRPDVRQDFLALQSGREGLRPGQRNRDPWALTPWFSPTGIVGAAPHPDFRIGRTFGNTWQIWSGPTAEVGDVLVVPYTHDTAAALTGREKAPRWLMLRVRKSGGFLLSLWREGWWREHQAVRSPGNIPDETAIAGNDLDELPRGKFDTLSRRFRQEWSRAWGTIVQRDDTVFAESDDFLDLLSAGGKRIKGETVAAAKEVGKFGVNAALLGLGAVLLLKGK